MLKKKKLPKTMSLPRGKIWKESRIPKDGKIVHEPTRKVAQRIDELYKEVEKGLIEDSGRDDVLAKALPPDMKEHGGRVRGKPHGVTQSSHFGSKKRKNPDGESKVDVLQNKVSSLEGVVGFLAKKLGLSKDELDELNQYLKPDTGHDTSQEETDNSYDNTHEDADNMHNSPQKDVDNVHNTSETPTTQLPKGVTLCLLALSTPKYRVVAKGKVFNNASEMSEFIHCRPLGNDEVKVSIDYTKEPDTHLPIPILNGPSTIGEAVGSFVAWPRTLIRIDSMDMEEPNSNDKEVGCKRLSKTSIEPKYKEPNDDVEISCLTSQPKDLQELYVYGNNFLREGAQIHFTMDKAVVGYAHDLYIGREEIKHLVCHAWLGASHISVYMRWLYTSILASNGGVNTSTLEFLCPHKIRAPDSRLGKTKVSEDDILVVKYIVDRFKERKNGVFLLPYNTGNHWVLNAIDPDQEVVYYMDPLHGDPLPFLKNLLNASLFGYRKEKPINRQRNCISWNQVKGPYQPNGYDCAYYVMRYMKEIVDNRRSYFSTKYFEDEESHASYSPEQIDEIRCQLSRYIRFYALQKDR